MAQEHFEHHQIKQALFNHYGEPVSFDIVLKIPMLDHQWEVDGHTFVVVTEKNETLFIDSDHGSLFVNKEFQKKLEDKKKEYSKYSNFIDEALKKLNSSR